MILALIPYVLQLALIIHAIRNGKSFNWIWLLVFVPLLGGIAYLLIEVLPDYRSHGAKVVNAAGAALNPGKKIRELKMNLELSRTPANVLELAKAYVEEENYANANPLFEELLSGYFKNDAAVTLLYTESLFRAKEFEKALAVVSTQLKVEDGSEQRRRFLFTVSSWHTGRDQQHLDELARLFDTTKSFEFGYYLAEIYAEQGEKSKIREVLEAMDLQRRIHKNFKRTMGLYWYRKTERLLG